MATSHTQRRIPGNVPRRHVVVAAPAEVDVVTVADLSRRLESACGSTDVITVDMTATTFCDVAGVRALLRAWELAKANGGELRLATSSAAVLRVRQLTGLAQTVPVYPDVRQSWHRGFRSGEAGDLLELGTCLLAPGGSPTTS